MKKLLKATLSFLLVVSVLASFATAFAANAETMQTELSFTVGLGTAFNRIGLPQAMKADANTDAQVVWNEGGYQPNKEGTYTLKGTATANGKKTALTAKVTVEDVGFQLPPLPDILQTRPYVRLNRNYSVAKTLACMPIVAGGANDDYQWSFRWYTASELGGPGTLYSTALNCPLDLSPDTETYYYCRVAATKDGVTRVLTSNYCLVRCTDDVLAANVTATADEIRAGDSFDVTASLAVMKDDGSYDRYYYWTSATELQYRPVFTFSCSNPAVHFSETELDSTTGLATVTVTTDETLNADFEIRVHVFSQLKSTVFTYPSTEKTVTKTIRVFTENGKTDASKYYTDVTAAWAYPAVDWMKENHYMNGTTATTFSHESPVTRAELVTVLYRIAGSPTTAGLAQKLNNRFTDLPVDADFVDPVLWATQNGVVAGTSKTTFSPEKTVTREQFAALLYRMAGTPEVPSTVTLGSFSDANAVSEYALDAMRWATGEGYIAGAAGKLSPKALLTRAQIAVVLQRYALTLDSEKN